MKRIISIVLSLCMAASVTTGFASPSDAGTDENLLVYYSFDSDTYDTVIDSSARSQDAQKYGTMSVSGNAVKGSSLLLKGGYVHMPETIIDGAESLSVSIWTNPLRAQNNSRVWDIGSNDQNFLNLFGCLEGNRYASALRVSNISNRAELPSGSFVTNRWTHIAVTYQNNTVTIYKDGSQTASINTGDRKVSDLSPVLNAYIGRAQFAVDPDYYGYVDEFKIYSKALSASEVNSEYISGVKSLSDSLTADMESVLLAKNGLSSLGAVMQDLSLPTADDLNSSGFGISYTSSNPGIISENGRYNSPEKITDIILTAAIERDGIENSIPVSLKAAPAGEFKADKPDSITVVLGEKPDLPKTLSANQGTARINVEWEDIPQSEYAYSHSFTVNGTTQYKEAVGITVNVDDTYIKNPIIRPHVGGAPDPYVEYHDGYYYYVRHDYNTGLTVSKAKRLQDIGSVPRVLVYKVPSSAGNNAPTTQYWAPEIHYIDGCFYIYVAACDSSNDNRTHRMYCFRATDPDDAQSEYELMGKVAPTKLVNGEYVIDEEQDKWAIDGTVIKAGGKLYFSWSGWEGDTDGQQNTYIAEMLNPWTLKGDRVLLNEPSAQWEKKGDPALLVNEGQQAMYHNGKVYLTYSANHSGSDWYCIGYFVADENADLLDLDSWTKCEGPLFTQSLDPSDKSYATGHAMITPSPDQTEQWLVYHAFQDPGAGWGDRSARIAKITWDGDKPVFGNPIPLDEKIKQPSGTPDVYAAKYEAEDAQLTSAYKSSRSRASGGQVVSMTSSGSSVTFDVIVPKSGKYLLSAFAGGRTSPLCSQTVTVGTTDFEITHYASNTDANMFRPSNDPNAEKQGDGLRVNLYEGVNKVTISRKSGNVDLDYIYLIYEGESDPELNPDPNKTPADYTEVDKAIASVPSDLSIYTDATANAVRKAVAAVDRNKTAAQQAEVDKYADDILKAVAGLVKKPQTQPDPNPAPSPQPSNPANGVQNGVLYVNGKAVTGSRVQKVGSVTYAVVNGKVAAGSKTRVVTVGSYKYIVTKNGTVTMPKKRSVKTVSGKSYVVGTNGRIMLSKKSNKLYKAGTRSYVVKKRTGEIIKSKKGNMLAKVGNKWYVVKKRTGAVIKGKKAMTAKVGKKTYVLKKRTGLVMRSTKKALKATVKGKRYTIAKRTGAARLAK